MPFAHYARRATLIFEHLGERNFIFVDANFAVRPQRTLEPMRLKYSASQRKGYICRGYACVAPTNAQTNAVAFSL